jgi:hypothetical protein
MRNVRVGNELRLKDSNLYVYPAIDSPDIIQIVAGLEDNIATKFFTEIAKNGSLKIGFGITVELDKSIENTTQGLLLTRNGFRNTFFTSASKIDVINFIRESTAHIIKNIEEFCSMGSGWAITRVDTLHLTIDKFTDLRGGSYIKSPDWIVNKKCCINVRNVDNECFRYALIAAVKPPTANKERVAYYNSLECKNLFNLDGIQYPTPICSRTFRRFEKQNPNYRLCIFICPSESKTREGLETCYMTDYVEGFLHQESKFLSPLELNSRYGDGHKEEGNPHTWPITKKEGLDFLHSYSCDANVRVCAPSLPRSLRASEGETERTCVCAGV